MSNKDKIILYDIVYCYLMLFVSHPFMYIDHSAFVPSVHSSCLRLKVHTFLLGRRPPGASVCKGSEGGEGRAHGTLQCLDGHGRASFKRRVTFNGVGSFTVSYTVKIMQLLINMFDDTFFRDTDTSFYSSILYIIETCRETERCMRRTT